MRFIITGDIHGNDVAFNEVLNKAVEKYGNAIDGFIDLGDFTCDFLWGEEVCQTLRNLKEKNLFYGINGNRETGMVKPYYNKKKAGEKVDWDIDSSMGAPLLSCERMSNETLEFINNMPDTLLIKFIDKSDNQKNDDNIVYIKTDVKPLPTPLFLKHKMPLTKEEQELLEKENCNTILTAHTHIVNSNNYDNYNIYNPGSVGLSGNGIPGADYAELFYKNGKWNFTTNHIEYNYNEIKEKVKANPILFEKCKNWGTALITAVDEGINVPALYMFEKNRIVQELAKGTNEIVLNPKDKATITSIGRVNCDVDYKGLPLVENVIYANGEDLSVEKKSFNQDETEKVDTKSVDVTDEIFKQALDNVLFYINEAKKNSTTEYEIITGRLKR